MTIPARHYIHINGRRVHYRRAGQGPVIVLLHGSPNSSAALADLMGALSDGFTAIALDTPGNGNSDPLPHPDPSTEDYAEALRETLDALGIRRCAFYGFHTGAGTAAEFAARYPERVSAVAFNGLAVWTDDEKSGMLKDYLTPFHPKADGSHLAALWSRVVSQTMFFPWHIATAQTRMIYDMPPPERLHLSAMDFLRAGDGYRAPYAAALRGNGAERVRRLTVPALITAHDLDPISHHLDRLSGCGTNVTIEHTHAGPDAMWRRIKSWFERFPADPAPPPAPAGNGPDGLTTDFIRAGKVSLHWRGSLGGSGRPLILLHDAGGSSRLFDPALAGIARERPVVALDLPGHGESDLAAADPASVENFAGHVAAAIRALGLDAPDCTGFHLGGQIAVELAASGLARRAAIIGAPHYNDAERAEHLEHYAPSIAPRFDGAQMLTAWHLMRFQALYYPWYKRDRTHVFLWNPRIGAETLHRRTVDLLKAGDRYRDAYRAQFTYSLAERLKAAPETMIFKAPFDPLSSGDMIGRQNGALTHPLPSFDLGETIESWAQPLAAIGG